MTHPYPQPFFMPPMEVFPSKLPVYLCFDGDEENGVRTIVSDPTMRVDAYCKLSVEKACGWLVSTLQERGVESSPAIINYGDGLSTQVYVRNVDRIPVRAQISLAMHLCLEEGDSYTRMAPSDLILDQLALRNTSEELKCAKVKVTLDRDPWVDHSLVSTADSAPDHRTTLLLIVRDDKMLKVVYDPTEKDIEDFKSLIVDSDRVQEKKDAGKANEEMEPKGKSAAPKERKSSNKSAGDEEKKDAKESNEDLTPEETSPPSKEHQYSSKGKKQMAGTSNESRTKAKEEAEVEKTKNQDEDDGDKNLPPTVKKRSPKNRTAKKKAVATRKSSSAKSGKRKSTSTHEELKTKNINSAEKETTEGASIEEEKLTPVKRKRVTGQEVSKAIQEKTKSIKALSSLNKVSEKDATTSGKRKSTSIEKEKGMTGKDVTKSGKCKSTSMEKAKGVTEKSVTKKGKRKSTSTKKEARTESNSPNDEETPAKLKNTTKMRWIQPGMTEEEKKEAKKRRNAFYKEQRRKKENLK